MVDRKRPAGLAARSMARSAGRAARRVGVGLLTLMAAGPAAADPAVPPELDGDTGSGPVAVVAIRDADTLELEGRGPVRLAGLQVPHDGTLAVRAGAFLEGLVAGHRVEMRFGTVRSDRHRRVLAHVVRDDGVWVQGAMLEAGLARVYPFPSGLSGVAAMLACEGRARRAGRGVWRHPAYAVRPAGDVARDVGTFQVVEGRAEDVAVVRGTTYLNFGDNWRTDFTIRIEKKAAAAFAAAGVDLAAVAGRLVRVRGWVEDWNGPMIEAVGPEQVETIDEESRPDR